MSVYAVLCRSNSRLTSLKTIQFLTCRQQRAYPGYVFSIWPEVDVSIKKKIVNRLLSNEARKFAESILQSLSGSKFGSVNSEEYENLNGLLNPVWDE